MYIGAFPDLRFDPQDMLSSGDKVVTRVSAGDDGLAHEHWGVVSTMMQQFGAVPEGPG